MCRRARDDSAKTHVVPATPEVPVTGDKRLEIDKMFLWDKPEPKKAPPAIRGHPSDDVTRSKSQ